MSKSKETKCLTKSSILSWWFLFGTAIFLGISFYVEEAVIRNFCLGLAVIAGLTALFNFRPEVIMQFDEGKLFLFSLRKHLLSIDVSSISEYDVKWELRNETLACWLYLTFEHDVKDVIEYTEEGRQMKAVYGELVGAQELPPNGLVWPLGLPRGGVNEAMTFLSSVNA